MFSKGKELDVDKERSGKFSRIAKSTGCEQEMPSNYWEMERGRKKCPQTFTKKRKQTPLPQQRKERDVNHLGGGLVVRAWD